MKYRSYTPMNTVPFTSTQELIKAIAEYDAGAVVEKYGEIEDWDVSRVDYFTGLFRSQTGDVLLRNLSKWNVSQVLRFDYLCKDAAHTPTGIGNWEVDSVISMESAFEGTRILADLSKWNTVSVVNMENMFRNSTWASEDLSKCISGWNVSNVITMECMFYRSALFNADLSKWDVSSVISLTSAFAHAADFTRDISMLDMGRVRHFASMFYKSGISVFSNNGSMPLSCWQPPRPMLTYWSTDVHLNEIV